jgi:hypothetical protein
MELRESVGGNQCNAANRSKTMTINKGSRRARGESWLVRATTRIRKAIKETYIVNAPKSKDVCQNFSYSDDAQQEAEATVLLKTGETVKVKAPNIERFLLENHGQVESHKRERRGRPRGKSSNNLNQQ